MNSKKTRRWLVLGGLLLVVAAVAIEPVVEWIASRRAKEVVETAPVEADWKGLDWQWSGALVMRDVELAVGPAGRLRVERLELPVRIGSVLSGEARAGIVTMEGVSAEYELSSSGDDAGAEAAENRGSRGRRPPICKYAEGFRIERGRLEIHRGERVALEARGGGRGTCDGEEVSLEADGELATVRGADVGERFALEATANLTSRSLTGGVTFPEGDEDTEGLQVDLGVASAAVGEVELEAQRTEDGLAGGAVLRGLDLSVGGADAPGGRVRTERLDLRFHPGGRVQIAVREPRVTLTPVELGRRLMRRGSDEENASQSKSNAPSGRNWQSLAYWAIGNVDLEVDDASVRIRLREGDDWRVLEPSRHATLRKRGRKLRASGTFADGNLVASAAWTPGQLVPSTGSLRLRDVDLEEVPVVRRGRSLPARGVRGKVGGSVDLGVHFARSGGISLFETARADFSAEWKNGWVDAEGLADEPVEGLDVDVDWSGVWHPAGGRAELESGQFRYGPVNVELEGLLSGLPVDPKLEFRAEAAEFNCQEAVQSLPLALLGPYDDVALEGEAAPVVTFEVPLRRPADLTLDIDGFPGSCYVTSLNTDKSGWPEITLAEPGSRSPPTAARSRRRRIAAMPEPGDNETTERAPPELEALPRGWTVERPTDVFWLRKPFVKRVTEGVSEDAEVKVGPGLPSYVPLAAMPTYVPGAAYLSEEINFYSDGGWNEHLIERALQMNFRDHRFVYGGSTVTQQLVKNLFLTRHKSVARKVQEALVAWRMQGVVSKDRVLELYLNCIEFGNDLYGIGPAAQHYFQLPAGELNVMEAVFLAAIKPAPWYGERFRDRGRTPESGWWPDRFEEIFDRLVDRGFIDRERADAMKPYVLKWDDQGRAIHRKKSDANSSDDSEEADAWIFD